jgi:hypothetical protein
MVNSNKGRRVGGGQASTHFLPGSLSLMRHIVPAAVAALPWRVVVTLTLLACFGSLVLYSSAGGDWLPWALPHLVRFGLLLGVVLLIVRRLSLPFLSRIAWPAYIATLAMLLLVELIGQIGGGSQRWLNLGVMTLQPSELMKIAILLLLARYFDQFLARHRAAAYCHCVASRFDIDSTGLRCCGVSGRVRHGGHVSRWNSNVYLRCFDCSHIGRVTFGLSVRP